MSRKRLGPPALAERLLELSLGRTGLREVVVGDLHEEYVERSRRSRTPWPDVWYWFEAMRLAVRFALQRALRVSPARARPAERVHVDRESAMSSIASDIRFALRTIRKQPGISLVVAMTLALGLGVNGTVFGMMDALLLRPFQFRDYQRLVVLWDVARGGSERDPVAPANFLDWRWQATGIQEMSAWAWLDATITWRGEPERVQGFRVSPGFFEMLGISPAAGRSFTADEGRVGKHRCAVIGYGLWQRRFAANPGIIGTDLVVDGEPHTVVGVAPPGFAFPVGAELWVPLAFTPEQAANRETRSLTVAGRLASNRSLDAAQAEMEVISRGLEEKYPDTNRDRSVSVRSLSTAFREGSTVPFVAILQAAAALVLLVACANVAGLLLAKALDRRREVAVRTALGASRGRIIRQLVTETIVLGLFASFLAILLASVGLDALRSSIPAETARFVEGWDNLRLDTRLLFAIPVLAIGVGIVIGFVPAVAGTRVELAGALKDGDRGTAGSVRRQRGRQALVVAEIGFALALLIAAGLTLAGGMRLVNQPGGFDSQALLTLQIPMPDAEYSNPDSSRAFASDLLEELEAIPMVESATLANVLPASGWSPAKHFTVDHGPVVDPAHWPRTGFRAVSQDFFETLRIPLVSGRQFTSADREDTQPVAIVSAATAERFWPGQNPIGRRLRLEGADSQWLHIVGVAGDVKMYNWWDGEDALAVYVPQRQSPLRGLAYVAIRAKGNPASIASAVRDAVKSVNSHLPVSNVLTMHQAIANNSAGLTQLAMLMGICGGLGLLLAVVGIYSVMSYAVSQRTHEFGVRIALGATARDLLGLTLQQAGGLTALGLALGFILAAVFGRLLGSALFGLVSLHAPTFVAVGLGLGLVSLAAACLPARRALRLDPAAILRGQ